MTTCIFYSYASLLSLRTNKLYKFTLFGYSNVLKIFCKFIKE